ncbi:MAG: NAD(P)/FAD-dependent oxidoreductase [Candidatus Neoclostridium sp.]
MEKTDVIIIGGGAAGLTAALAVDKKATVLERSERVGRKLSATGNGQGNVGNVNAGESRYFTFGERRLISSVFDRYPQSRTLGFFENLGFVFGSDDRGRIYPSSRQASSITDLMRFNLAVQKNKRIITGATVSDIEKKGDKFVVSAVCDGKTALFEADKVILCAGGKAAKNFGTDGKGYALAKKLGHTVTDLYPSLVQLKTDTTHVRSLKGQRVNAVVTAICDGRITATETGDVIFTDYGVSGDAIFRISAFIADKIDRGAVLSLDLMPGTSVSELENIIITRTERAAIPEGETLCGVLSNVVGRAVIKRAGEINARSLAALIKNFTLKVTGTTGFDCAQVTKGGVLLSEVGEDMQSKITKGLYFAGEILDVDGQCGGYNLQWAFSSALVAAESVNDD